MSRILIALCGKNPQVITETLFSLHTQGRFPTRLIILTTEIGRSLCRSQLLDPASGHLPALLRYIGQPVESLTCVEDDILTPSSRAGYPVTDIATEEDSRHFFELCLKTVFQLACNHETELLFSIAGGRKTMSAALALAAQCYARPQDAMFHVLVPPELEADPQFYFPDTAELEAAVSLTPIPFFRMRSHLPGKILSSPASLEEVNRACQPHKPLKLEVCLNRRQISCDGRTVNLPPALFAIYAFFALMQTPCPQGISICPAECYACGMTWPHIASRRNELLYLYQQVEGRSLARGKNGILHLSADNFRSSLAKIRKIFAEQLGEYIGTRLSIISVKKDGLAQYALRLPRSQIFKEPQRCDC